jgi:hypothetical protein
MAEHTSLLAIDEANRQAARERLDAKERRTVRLVVATLAVVAFYAVAVTVVAAMVIANQQSSRTAASSRITALQGEIRRLADQVSEGNRRTGELAGQVVVLQAQVAELGGEPLVAERPAEATTSQRTTSTTVVPPTTSTTQPPTTTSTTTPPQRCVAGGLVCLTR